MPINLLTVKCRSPQWIRWDIGLVHPFSARSKGDKQMKTDIQLTLFTIICSDCLLKHWIKRSFDPNFERIYSKIKRAKTNKTIALNNIICIWIKLSPHVLGLLAYDPILCLLFNIAWTKILPLTYMLIMLIPISTAISGEYYKISRQYLITKNDPQNDPKKWSPKITNMSMSSDTSVYITDDEPT